MAAVTINYTAAVALTWTPASLASGSYDGSANVTNAANKFVDFLVGGFITTGTSPTVGQIRIYAYASWDGGTTYTAGMAGTDGDSPDTGEDDNLILLAVIETDATSDHRYEWGPVSIAQAFRGVMPERWGLVVFHDTVAALNATAGNHEAKYTGIKYDVA